MTSLELCKKMEVMGSGKSVAVCIVNTPQQCGRNSACVRACVRVGGETSVDSVEIDGTRRRTRGRSG
jgi:hypothetical protein